MPAADTTPQLPHNTAFEREVLGAAIVDDDARDTLTGIARVEHFYGTANRAIFTAITDAYAEGRVIDGGLLARALTRDNTTLPLPEDTPTAERYLATLIAERCPAVAVRERLRDIKACYDARELHAAAKRMQDAALDTEGDAEAVEQALTNSSERLAQLTENIVGHPWQSLSETIREAQETSVREVSFTSGLRDLDKKLGGGFRPGQYVTIAARPGQGKSTLAVDFARQASIREGVPGLVVSMEMTAAEISERILAAEGGVNLSAVTRRELTDREADRVQRGAQRAQGAPLYLLTPEVAQWASVRSSIVSAHRRLGIKYVVIDYLQLLSPDSSIPNGTNREQFLGGVSRSLKNLALHLGITVFVVAQLNRNPEQRSDGRPMVSDLRESGQLEQDADVILLIHLPQTYDPTTPRAGEADIIIGKHRGGEMGVVAVSALLHYSKFVDMAHDPAPETY